METKKSSRQKDTILRSFMSSMNILMFTAVDVTIATTRCLKAQ